MPGGFTDHYTGPVTDPFRISGADGNTYFDVLHPPKRILEFYEKLLNFLDWLVSQESRARDPAVRAYWAGNVALCDRALAAFRADMRRLSTDTSYFAESRIRGLVDRTAVRPPTSGDLRSAIDCRPIIRRLEMAEVGIGDLSSLGQVDYWEAQEFGTDAHVGRIVRGAFMPGRVRPDPAQFRQHPVFQAGGGGRMRIQRPIDGRGFLRQGIEDAGRFRHRGFQAAKTKVIAVLNQIAAGTPPPPRQRTTQRSTQRRRR